MECIQRYQHPLLWSILWTKSILALMTVVEAMIMPHKSKIIG